MRESTLAGRLRHLFAADQRQRGTAEAALLYPLLLGLTFVVIQLGFYFHAATIASATATIAFNAAHGQGAADAHGHEAADLFLTVRPGQLLDPSVQIARTPDALTVTVSGRAPGIFPGWVWLDVQGTHTGPVERWTD